MCLKNQFDLCVSVPVCVSCLKVWKSVQIFIKLGRYFMQPEDISIAYFIISSHQLYRHCFTSVSWSYRQSIVFLGRVISSSQGLYLNTGQHKHRINAYIYQTSMPCVGLEPTIPASERTKTVYATDRLANVTGYQLVVASRIFDWQ
jgi:hypothetical protein